MRFEHPSLLWFCLLVLPSLTLFLVWAWRKKQWLISQFVQSRLLANLTVGVSPTRQKVRLSLLVASVALLLLALARPQWGFDWEEARQRGLDIIVAVDTSRSMLAKDVSPNRLERAKLAALDLVKLARSDRLGLVAFAGGAFLQCPLTIDDGAFRQSLNALDTSIIPQGGTTLAEAIRAALGAFEEKNDNYRILVMFTDGEDHDGHAMDAARKAEEDGLRIFTVGVGTANGELLAIPNPQGTTDYLKDDQGNVVKSRLNEPLLQQIAQATGGFYMLLTGANTIDLLYERGLAPLPKAEFASRQIRRYHERYQWFLGLAMILLVLEMFLPERKRVPRSEAILTGSANEPLQRAVGLLLCLLLPGSLFASAGSALKQYRDGRYEAARLQFERLLEKSPNDPRLHFNAGNAAYQAGDFEAAARHFQSALVTPDLPLQQNAYYNLGNTQYRLGDDTTELQDKQQAWQQALSHYQSALKLNAQDQDAQFNLEFVKKRLEELKQQQQQQQDQQQNQDPNQDQNENQEDQQKSDQPNQSSEQDKNKEQQSQSQSGQDSSQKQEPKPEPNKPNEPKPDNSKPKQEDQKSGQSQGQDANQQEPKGEENGQPNPDQLIQMTPEQARRLLDTVGGEEKTLIFLPPNFTNRTSRILRNW